MNHDVNDLLRSPTAGQLLQAAVETAGLSLTAWQLERVYNRPGAETSAKYRVQASGADMMLVISTVDLDDEARAAMSAVRAESDRGTVHIWAYPRDPRMPGLEVVEDTTSLPTQLSRVFGSPVEVLGAELLVLRPLRRAVHRAEISVDGARRTVYLKTVRPERAVELIARHTACSLAPVARDAGDGIVVTDSAAGVPLTHVLHAPTAAERGLKPLAGLLDPGKILPAAAASYAPSALEFRQRTHPVRRLHSFVGSLTAHGADPHLVGRLIARTERQMNPEPGPLVPVHGDLHPANIFMDPQSGEPCALIDLDTLGPGYAVDDAATMLGHLIALPGLDSSGYQAAADFTQRTLHYLGTHHDPADVAARAAAVLLSLAPGARNPAQLEWYLSAAQRTLDGEVPAVASHQ